MHKSFYKLDCEPFDLQPDLMFLWMGEKYKEALSMLRYGILDNKGFLLLTGAAGIGKTILLRALTEALPPEVLWAILPNPDAPKMEMFNIIGKGFGMNKEYNSKIEFMLDFGAFLQERHREGKKMLLLVDSAQLLNQENLEELRLLSNIEEADTKLIHIFFAAQPSFGDILTLSRNSAIRQRLNLAHTIEPLTAQETIAYIEHRLRVAGARDQILTEKAMRSVHHFSGGIPKKINLICHQVLTEGAQQGRKTIEHSAVHECMRKFARFNPDDDGADMNFPAGDVYARDSEEQISNPRKMLIPGISALALVAIIACAGYFFWLQSNQNARPTPHASTAAVTPPSASAPKTKPPQADTPAVAAADTPASIIDRIAARPIAPPASATQPASTTQSASTTPPVSVTPPVDSSDNAGVQGDTAAATVIISPATGLAVIQPPAGASAQNQTAQAASAPAATPPSAGTTGGKQQPATNGNGIIADQHPGNVPMPAPPATQMPGTSARNDAPPQASASAPPPVDNGPLPQLKAALPLRANSLSLTREGNALLADFVEKFKKTGHGKIEVRGYVSSTSNSKENIELSLRRAEAVRDMLIHAGIKPASIVTRGMGNQEPLLKDADFNGRSKNRRVELEMIP